MGGHHSVPACDPTTELCCYSSGWSFEEQTYQFSAKSCPSEPLPVGAYIYTYPEKTVVPLRQLPFWVSCTTAAPLPPNVTPIAEYPSDTVPAQACQALVALLGAGSSGSGAVGVAADALPVPESGADRSGAILVAAVIGALLALLLLAAVVLWLSKATHG